MREPVSFVVAVVTALVVGSGSLVAVGQEDVPGPMAAGNPGLTANVMAPLKITDFPAFENDLKTVKAYGVNGVNIDVWWGDVEGQADNRFDWSYYDRVFKLITADGLHIAPILSFHQCGGNVNDTYTSLLPAWLWPKYDQRWYHGIRLGIDGLKYRSEQGHYSPETVQGWADEVVESEYRDFTRAFADHFGQRYRDDIVEINVSLGPSGELRYPSYNAHDVGTGYPTRGALQSYSSLAVADFRTTMLRKYRSVAGINATWGTAYRSPNEITPPADAQTFFVSGSYRNSAYGRDFVDWYNGSLVDHGKRVLETVVKALGHHFPRANIGYKLPGIHWTMTSPAYPRAAEVTTGLIQTSVDVDSRATGHGYRRIIDLANRVHACGRTVTVYFTALEMGDQNSQPAYSLAKTLVGWIGQYAHDDHVVLKGENALPDGVHSDIGWDDIHDAFGTWGYLGLTVLRISDVAEGIGAERYALFIDKYRH